MTGNILYYGDNLPILRKYIPDSSVDLIYLDPPFNSNRSYNVLFKESSGREADAQIAAFDDTWTWGTDDVQVLQEIHQYAPHGVVKMLHALVDALGHNAVSAYVVMMTARLVELHRVLKPTGSLYLHCDPTASHYLKVIMDAIFEPRNFRTEITWKRSSAHSDAAQGRRQHGRIHDIIFFYTKSDEWTWNQVYTPYDKEYIDTFYRYVEPETGRRYRVDNLTAAKPGGDTLYEWKGVRPYKGRYWAYSKANMERFEQEGRLYYTKSGIPCYKRYLDEMPGVSLQDLWDDIAPTIGKERLGYPTQKPLVLLERIIQASSNPGDVVLDPFCGCGTAVVAAQKLDRAWIGIDITHLAISLIKYRLEDTFGGIDYQVIGEPTSLAGARELADQDRYQFQWWALSLVRARPYQDKKKGADTGIDGLIYFQDAPPAHGGAQGGPKLTVVQVKSGHVSVTTVRELAHVVEREKAAIGLLITLEAPSKNMQAEALAVGSYVSPVGTVYPKLQILTIEGLLAGDQPKYPYGTNVTFKTAEPHQPDAAQKPLL